MLDRIIMCDECKNEFFLKSVNINSEIIELNNVPVNLVYFACPKCNKIYKISIQDKRYFELLEDLERIKKKMKKAIKNKDIKSIEHLNLMVSRKHERLGKHVEKLNNMFLGQFVFETSEDGNERIKYLP